MEKTCINCEHFAQRNLDVGRYLSACRKKSNKEVIFKWVNETCPDFEPKQQNENAAQIDNRNN